MTVKTPRKDAPAAQSATSLPLAPADDAGDRVRNYLVTMGIRIVCLCLTGFITPYGWYTLVFAAGAIFLPYIAVVGANAASGRHVAAAVRPDAAALDAPARIPSSEKKPPSPTIIRIAESPTPDASSRRAAPGAASPHQGDADPSAPEAGGA